MKVVPVGEADIVITREFAAARRAVFDAHTRPELLRRWFGPHGWRMTVCEVDLRVGGSWYYLMVGPAGAEMTLRGTYVEISAPERIVSTETNVDCEARAEHESVSTIVLVERDGCTTLTNTVRFPSRRVRDAVLESRMEHGVAEGFERLDAVLVGEGEIAARYRRRADGFESLLRNVHDGQWDGPSPCVGWRVRDVVRHVVEMHGVLLGSAGRTPSPGSSVDEDPLAAFRSARRDIQDVLADPALAATEFEAPHAGRTTVEVSIDQVVSADLPLHGWDVARATGQDYAIPDEEVEWGFRALDALPEEVLRLPYVYGPPVPVPPEASAHDRLLGLIGRDPDWTP
ncbi:TIGR03086 family metal-binding protein [Actinophytocola xanthii]|uniref:TIGR03086 family protein n=1 Tax=Actinophytocola xanthii TaxID=1912961 RepID=A0A1Q8CYR4_9PSEU|nr:TIGR03086 family metal-binding protein [Actinophytocola xanthii]OLF19500.1 TIGR03086 family protein [Actinophytocola xanthii]